MGQLIFPIGGHETTIAKPVFQDAVQNNVLYKASSNLLDAFFHGEYYAYKRRFIKFG